ncbi:MAG: NUDIX hydrolase [Gammaproteobacteria bacterium]|nr:NUDIX hydrolase [Gammaproteobacteria bacterium]NBT43583.1 NUDIX hydrolase [Gammaproteobacteria bacterium]NDE33294.1 NUDIX hydrolase [Gammaproteobacteria bacterium]NDE55454.1 NUDIX hydrolase [Gammaproteobacteria bacterium]NDG86470.1 NUDIX hydrolase [Gammaproteobacteria bacterium]
MVLPSLLSPVRPRLTVAAVVEDHGRFLMVEERDRQGRLVINQPAGHVEGGESLVAALIREALEETGFGVEPLFVVGAYLWMTPDGSLSYLRMAIAAKALNQEADRPLDEGIERAIWLSRDELVAEIDRHRSPLVLRCVDDYLSGEHYPLTLMKSFIA